VLSRTLCSADPHSGAVVLPRAHLSSVMEISDPSAPLQLREACRDCIAPRGSLRKDLPARAPDAEPLVRFRVLVRAGLVLV
jgi:hypothetical protein